MISQHYEIVNNISLGVLWSNTGHLSHLFNPFFQIFIFFPSFILIKVTNPLSRLFGLFCSLFLNSISTMSLQGLSHHKELEFFIIFILTNKFHDYLSMYHLVVCHLESPQGHVWWPSCESPMSFGFKKSSLLNHFLIYKQVQWASPSVPVDSRPSTQCLN